MTGVLATNVLLLNRNYAVIDVISVRRAFEMLCGKVAEVVRVEDGRYNNYDMESWTELSELKVEFEDLAENDDLIRTPSLSFLVPRVLRTLFYCKLPDRTVRLNRRNLFARDGNRCQYCGKKKKAKDLSIDHVNPRAKGGLALWENVVCACVECNSRKGGRTPVEAGMKLRSKPLAPRVSPRLKVSLGAKRYASWKDFVSEAYWNVELEE